MNRINLKSLCAVVILIFTVTACHFPSKNVRDLAQNFPEDWTVVDGPNLAQGSGFDDDHTTEVLIDETYVSNNEIIQYIAINYRHGGRVLSFIDNSHKSIAREESVRLDVDIYGGRDSITGLNYYHSPDRTFVQYYDDSGNRVLFCLHSGRCKRERRMEMVALEYWIDIEDLDRMSELDEHLDTEFRQRD